MRAALASFLVTASLASAAPLPGLPELKAAADQLVPTPITVDVSAMPASERKTLARLAQGELPAEIGKTLGPTYLAGMFRGARFGLNEAHGKGTAVQLNWLLDAGAYRVGADGRFTLVPEKFAPAVESLARELLTIEATGDKARAKALLDRLAVNRPETQRILSRLGKVPVDIAPRYVTAEQLEAEFP